MALTQYEVAHDEAAPDEFLAWFPGPVGKLDSAGLFADAEAVGGLVDHPGWEVVQRLVAARVLALVREMRGKNWDQAAFVRQNAEMQGLERVLAVPGAVLYAAETRRRQLEQETQDGRGDAGDSG